MSITITQEGVLGVASPGQPNETHVLQAPQGGKWTLLADGTTGGVTLTDGAPGVAQDVTLYDPNGTPWAVSIDDSGVLFLNGFDKNIVLAPAVNNSIILDGIPAMGYHLFAFVPGTDISAQTYKNSAFISVQPIPIILNDWGLPTDPIFLVSGVDYDFALVHPDGGDPIKVWRNVRTGPPSDTDSITQWSAETENAVFRDAESFIVTGDARAVFRSGRRVKLTQSSTIYGVIVSAIYDGAETSVSVILDSGSIDITIIAATVGLLSPSYGAIPGRRHIGLASFLAGNVTIPFTGGLNILTAGMLGICLKPVPAGWLECNGQAVSRTTYAALFDSVGTTFGAGNGTTTFNVPTIATTGMGANTATTNAIAAGNLVYAIYAQG